MKTSKMISLSIIIIFVFSLTGIDVSAAENPWNNLENMKLPKSVVKGLSEQFNDVDSLEDLKYSCNDDTDFSSFRSHKRFYICDAAIDNIWKKYKEADLKSAWSGKMINFGFAYSRDKNEIYSSSSSVSLKPVEGLGLFLELNIAKILKIPVAFEVSSVNEKIHLFQFTYLKRNKSNGRQNIIMKSLDDGKTMILHHTYFKSDKKFRDKYLYAPFHTQLIDQFHEIILDDIFFKAAPGDDLQPEYESSARELIEKILHLGKN